MIERKASSMRSRTMDFRFSNAQHCYFQMFRPPRPAHTSARKITPGIRNIGEATPIIIPRENPNSHMAIGVTITIVKMTQYFSFTAHRLFLIKHCGPVKRCIRIFPTSPATLLSQIAGSGRRNTASIVLDPSA
jgi:hypothetical protein